MRVTIKVATGLWARLPPPATGGPSPLGGPTPGRVRLPALFFRGENAARGGKEVREDGGQRLRSPSLSSPHPGAAQALSKGREHQELGLDTWDCGISDMRP